MKKNLLLITIILCFAAKAFSQNTFPSSGAVGIGTTAPNGKSILEIKSTTKGVLFPRMTKAQRDAITSPPDGLIIYQTDNTAGVYYYQGSWKAINNVRGLNNNLFIGQYAGNSNGSGVSNIALGKNALKNNITQSTLVAIGDSALYSNEFGASNPYDGEFNLAVGFCSLKSNTIGYHNTAVGSEALKSNVDGTVNCAFGRWSLFKNTSGSSNTAMGHESLYNNVTGSNNVAVGNNVLVSNVDGVSNTAIGAGAMMLNASGLLNVAVGVNALYGNTYGSYNVGVGFGALQVTSTSQYNTAIGYDAGSLNDHGYNNVFVGANTFGAGSGLYNIIALGQGTSVYTVSTARFGNSATGSYGGWAGWTNLSDGRFKRNIKENVPGLEFINKLRPVTYNMAATDLDAFYHKNAPLNMSEEGLAVYHKALKEKEQILYTGFIAQEVEAAAKELNFDFSGVDKPKNQDEDTYGLRYAEFTVPLVKAVQELSKENAEIKMRNEKLEAEVAAIKEALSPEQKQKVISSTLLYENRLEQNNPNPFNQSTVIRYQLLSDDANSKIIIRDLNGNLVKQVSITQPGKGQVTINANELARGTYTYTLDVNGDSIDTKIMVITK